jgi:hypothetical protein
MDMMIGSGGDAAFGQYVADPPAGVQADAAIAPHHSGGPLVTLTLRSAGGFQRKPDVGSC